MKEEFLVPSDVVQLMWQEKSLTSPSFANLDVGINAYILLVDEQDISSILTTLGPSLFHIKY